MVNVPTYCMLAGGDACKESKIGALLEVRCIACGCLVY